MITVQDTVWRASIVRNGNKYVVCVLLQDRVTEYGTYPTFDRAFAVWRELNKQAKM